MTKKIYMIAGPNGAGKTTTAFSINRDLLKIYEFLNADEMAKGLAPFHSESMSLTAGKLMIKRLKDMLHQERSFAFETTAAGTNYLNYLSDAKKNNYEINLLFLWLSSPELAIKRVQHRVAQGGHNIPRDTIIRRYHLGVKNLINEYLHLADSTLIIDNSSSGKLVAEKAGTRLTIHDERVWDKLNKEANG